MNTDLIRTTFSITVAWIDGSTRDGFLVTAESRGEAIRFARMSYTPELERRIAWVDAETVGGAL